MLSPGAESRHVSRNQKSESSSISGMINLSIHIPDLDPSVFPTPGPAGRSDGRPITASRPVD
ncbi:hypothetical protein N7491_005496 [Penicillium cf. griseofulvum]|uniref:Uncharacterized protein n=1 Tax=Penicillium cf. griseofulvum TaxID=2972120 RepID=A0A9W9M6M2_9EURO|nr:hypothetical protein N7472_008186 [Penicillium cf. griseofulvum]KAJ5434901.1 hypothetical protein N7491_005496 [Penicillium cf. griseofulvum]KAJ5452734.1 hypothetical protein N7445_000917 [Penicillium cf. griseofulvum]